MKKVRKIRKYFGKRKFQYSQEQKMRMWIRIFSKKNKIQYACI